MYVCCKPVDTINPFPLSSALKPPGKNLWPLVFPEFHPGLASSWFSALCNSIREVFYWSGCLFALTLNAWGMRPWVCWGCFDVHSKKPVCAEGAHSQLTGTQWLHLSLKVNTRRGGPQMWPFQMPGPPRLSILCDNEQIPIQKHLLCDSVALWCRQHTWVNELTTSLLHKIAFTVCLNLS